MKRPINTTWAIPEFDRIGEIFIKKQSKVLWYGNQLSLVWINKKIKSLLHYINSISYDNNMGSFGGLNSLANSISVLWP